MATKFKTEKICKILPGLPQSQSLCSGILRPPQLKPLVRHSVLGLVVCVLLGILGTREAPSGPLFG